MEHLAGSADIGGVLPDGLGTRSFAWSDLPLAVLALLGVTVARKTVPRHQPR
ncbi:hypothetical protein OH779_40445 [Actinacidiphila glaucinigra]|uniref:hypothetical protein n=1 Tax=Actinacidiphila glaucinigra TaxID=235986 RepID=UPI003869B5C8